MHYLTHYPKRTKCDVCPRTKMQNRHCRRNKETTYAERHKVEKFGDLITADAFFSYDGLSVDGDALGVVISDAYTGWLACYREKKTPRAPSSL